MDWAHQKIYKHMLKIAHRGNTHGPQPTFENTVEYLRKAWLDEYDVEMDLIGYKGKLYLGHDEPQELAPQEYICSKGTWLHAKNHEAAQLLVDTPNVHWFWHQDDDFALTSKGFIWCFPGIYIDHPRAVWLNFDDAPMPDTSNIYGLCSDEF